MKANNSIIPNENKKVTFSNFLTNQFVKQKIIETVGGKDAQKFMTSILSAVTNNQTLQECDQMSILNCAFLGQALNLTPSPQLGQYYMVPFNDKNKGVKVAQFQLGYKGYIQLAIRSGYYKKINVLAIKEGELIKYDPLEEEIEVKLIDDDDIREETPTVGYFAMFEYENGFKKTLYWTKKKMLSHADKYSKAFNKDSYIKLLNGEINNDELWKYSSFWYKDFDGMAYKTMLRQLISKWGIMSVEMQEAYSKDMATFDENGNAYFVENDEEQKNAIIVEPVSQEKNIEKDKSTANKEETAGEMLENAKKPTKAKSSKKQEEPLTDDVNLQDMFFS